MEYARGSLVPCQRNFFLVVATHDSILEFCFLHCKFRQILEIGATYRHSTARTLDSTNFTVGPGWKISDGPTTFSVGVETSILLQVQRLGAVDRGRYESRRLGSTLQIFHRILLYIEQPNLILYKIPCRVDAFGACALKRLANLA